MKTFGFPHPGPLTAGVYLLGSPRWAQGADLLQARVNCRVGTSVDPTLLGMEVDGTLTEKTILIQPRAAGELISNAVYQIGYALAPDATIRWKVVSAPSSGGLTRVGLTLVAAALGTSIAPAPELYVVWRNGAENFRIFDYTSATHSFAESSSGIATGRAAIVNATDLSVTIQAVEALRGGADTLYMNLLYCAGGSMAVGQTGPRLEFYAGPRRLGTLTQDGSFYVPDLTEDASVPGGTDRFEFYGAGARVAVLGAATRLRALTVEEPL